MSSSSRPTSPAGALSVPAQIPQHEAPHAQSTSASPVPPTPPPKDYVDLEHRPPAADKMSKLGLKAAPPEVDPADIVIDISGPVRADADESYVDPDSTLRASTDVHVHPYAQRGADTDIEVDLEGETEADITTAHRAGDTPTPTPSAEHEPGGSTLYGSGSGSDRERERERERDGERERVQEHPLRLDVHPPSPPAWEMQDEAERGRISPQRYEFRTAKTRTIHDFSNKPRSSNRPLIPHSAYYFGPPPVDSAYGTDPVGQIGVHHPREIVRIERDYSGGELPQFSSTYPLELEGRRYLPAALPLITPTQFLETINAINEILLSAHSTGHAFVDNALAFFSLQVSRAVKKSHYEKEMERLKATIDMLNEEVYNPVGLHIKWPRSVAFLFMEIEYYVSSSHVCQDISWRTFTVNPTVSSYCFEHGRAFACASTCQESAVNALLSSCVVPPLAASRSTTLALPREPSSRHVLALQLH
ncbi:hypothetical protein BV20DRAFT_1121707 [Pilatotrama ljubarskyi]|nr:hypothetical protein BV20DRAFT_1121707 [Pilatotrama ljubarskyi]